jgi:putative phosphoesterase
VAVIADVHGNAAALDAVLAEIARSDVDAVVVAGDVVPGAQPSEVLSRLRALGTARFVRGNGDREAVEAFDAGVRFDPADDVAPRMAAWTAERIDRAERDFLAGFEAVVTLEVEGVGAVLVCHGTPGSDERMLTSLTPEDAAARELAGVEADVVVGGHTHAQYDRRVGAVRLVNAGSVGLPYEGRGGAFWLMLGPDVELRRTDYDVESAAAEMAASGFVDAWAEATEMLLDAPTAREVEEHFERVAAERGER